MAETIFTSGNEAVGWGALNAGCTAFFGYPITPQNEITAWFAEEYPKRGLVFVQSQSEVGSINLVWGGAAAGARAMTSTSSVGWSLMQEGMTHLVNAELPALIVLVSRGGPGTGTMRHSQMDYLSATHGGGSGGYKLIVLAPASVQETHDHVQLAFHLADKYRNPVVILTDGMIGQIQEKLEVKTLDLGPVEELDFGPPRKDRSVAGKANNKDGRTHMVHSSTGMVFPEHYGALLAKLDKKFRAMESEVRYETHFADDADLLVVAFGHMARISLEAINMARAKGLKVGMIRPITVWPFPYQVIKEKAAQGAKFLVAEDNLGLMIDDVRMGVEGKAKVHLLGALARHLPTDMGIILPERVLEEIERILGSSS